MASQAVGRFLGRAPIRAATAGSRREFSALLTPVEEYPGLPALSPEPTKASSASVTALSNGLTVVSEDASSTSTVSLTFPKAGSADEASSEAGAALVNKCLSFKSSSGLSSALILRSFQDHGAVPFATAGRKGATIGFTAAPDVALKLVPLLGVECDFEKWDVRDAKDGAAAEVAQASSSAQSVLTEQLFAAAYGAQSPMGKPFYSAGPSADAIASFRSRTYGLNGAVLSATGVPDHAAFVSAVEEMLATSPAGSDAPAAKATYMGGEARVAASAGYAHVALAFEGPAASALSSVLKKCFELKGVSAFGSDGLVGVYGSGSAAEAAGVVDSLCAAVTTAPSADIVKRAKALAKAEALFALDGGSQALAESMAASVLENGTFSAKEVAAAYDGLADSAVQSAFSAMLKSKPAMAAVGDISSVPYHATVASRFN